MNSEVAVQEQKSGNSKIFIISSFLLLLVHSLLGFFQTPSKILEASNSQNMPELSVKIGYAFGILFFIALPIPVVISLLSLIFKSKRNLSSFSKIFFYCLCISLILNGILNFILVPSFINDMQF